MDTIALPGGHWLDLRAGRSLVRCWDAGCPTQITDAGRTRAEQQALRDRWEAGTGNFAWPPDDPRANHIGGMAVDLPWGGRTWMRNSGAGWDSKNKRPTYNEWGWSGVENEDWHFNYGPKHDKHLEDDMLTNDDIAAIRRLIREETAKVPESVWTATPDGFPYTAATAVRNTDKRTQAIRAGQVDPSAFAQSVATILKGSLTGSATIDPAVIEAALRKVLGSVDNIEGGS